MSLYKIARRIVVLFCVCITASHADDTGDNVAELIESGLKRSDLQSQNCSRMLKLEDARFVCGYLRVPENYAVKNSDIIKIPFLVIMPEEQAFDSTLTPLLVTGGGGPGNAILGDVYSDLADDHFWTYEEFSVADGRALMILENRGVGLSQPNLDCHYQPEIFQRDFWPVLLKTDFSCGLNYQSDGVDLSQYHVRNAALDIEMFRHLYAKRGINTSQLNLYGISYGTRVAMVYESMFPLATRSLVLDSVVVNDQSSGVAELVHAQRSLDLVFSKCRSEKQCRKKYGLELEKEFYGFLQKLDTQKISLEVIWPDSAESFAVPLTGSLVVNVLHDALYSSETIANIPSSIKELINGSYDAFTSELQEHLNAYSSRYAFSDTAFLTYLCFDADYSKKSRRDLSGFKLYPYWDLEQGRRYMQRVCTEYGIAAKPNRRFNLTVSETPTLFLSGELDPVTPPENASKAAQRSIYHWNIVRANVSHDVIIHSSCARLLASWFIYHPQEDLESRENDCQAGKIE